MATGDQAVSEHYARRNLTESILSALHAAGRDTVNLAAEDLAPIDQFHVRGREATLELARLAGLGAGIRVLDVGGGLGGPARTLASEFGCTVEVLDATEEYCRAGAALTARTGLAGSVSFRHGDALHMPYPDTSFDAAWTQHSSMNVADKAQLYREIHRILRPGGVLALHEIMSGHLSPIHLPVPWACEPHLSHLIPPATARALLRDTGFEEIAWTDDTRPTLQWFTERLQTPAPAITSPLGLHLLLGDRSSEMLRNLARNLRERRVTVVQGLLRKRRPLPF